MTSISAYLLLMILINALNATDGQAIPQGFIYGSYEVIIPRKLTPRYGQQEPRSVTYLLPVEGKGQVVLLRQKKGIVPKEFPIFTYNKEGELQVDYPFIRDDCFYRGFVKGKSTSVVTLSTCSGGLRGILQMEDKIYQIEPVQTSDNFQHVVYHLEKKEGAAPMRCGLTKKEEISQETMMWKTKEILKISKRDFQMKWWPHTRYVENAIVVDHNQYLQFGKNETIIAMQVLDVIHMANSYYDPLSIQLSLVGLEIWTEKNLIKISGDIAVALRDFTNWRINVLLKRLQSDAAHLFVYTYFGIVVGKAYVGTICKQFGTSVVELRADLFVVSVIFAHEVGHILGMQHDGKHCVCDRDHCIMDSSATRIDQFSNCSYADYFRYRNTYCLLNPPDPNKIYNLKYCGNKIVENGEDCDCGTKSQCKSDPCCQSNCRLRPRATCAFGLCCKKCQYARKRSICRKSASVCDLPEYCNGTSEKCPDDVYVQDGAPCKDGAYCYHGNCTTHTGQCKKIFGPKAVVASENCFRVMNTWGDRFGNCKLKHGIYTKCAAEDILCGRIQCENVNAIPNLEDHSTIIQSQIGGSQCWGTDYHSGMEIADIGAVIDGTPCGTDMMCIDRHCVNVSLLIYDCNVTKCHNHGTCNTHKHCHCKNGWAPPFCLNKGFGGSIDSGPASEGRRITVEESLVGILFVFSTIDVGLNVMVGF